LPRVSYDWWSKVWFEKHTRVYNTLATYDKLNNLLPLSPSTTTTISSSLSLRIFFFPLTLYVSSSSFSFSPSPPAPPTYGHHHHKPNQNLIYFISQFSLISSFIFFIRNSQTQPQSRSQIRPLLLWWLNCKH